MLHEMTEKRTSRMRTTLEMAVDRAINSTIVGAEPSGAAPPCACTSRAKVELPSKRKRPSGTLAVCAAGTAPPGRGSPDVECAELYHEMKELSNVCYDWSSVARVARSSAHPRQVLNRDASVPQRQTVGGYRVR